MNKKPNLRRCINDKCRSCIYDPQAAGTWRQQVTLCSVTNCALYPVRPTSKAPIPESVLDYYCITGSERAFYGFSRPPEGPLSKHNPSKEYTSKGPSIVSAKNGPNHGGTQ